MSRTFVATSAPGGWPLGRWSQLSPSLWEERKLQDPKTAYQFQVISGPDAASSSTVRLKLKDQSTEVLLLESTAQIFVDGSYFGEYVGQWQMQNGQPAPPPVAERGAPPPVAARGGRPQRGAQEPPPAPYGQKAAPPAAEEYGAPQKAAPPPPARGGNAPRGGYEAPAPAAAPRGAPMAENAPRGGGGPSYDAPPPRPEKQGFDRDPKNVQRLIDACRSGDVGSVKSMLATVDPDAPGRDGKTPLMVAADKGNLDIVQALLDAGADPNIGKDGNTPMTAAFQKGHQEVLRVLFQASFASLENIVGPSGAEGPVYAQAGYGDDEVPESALLELREVTAKLAAMSSIPQAPSGGMKYEDAVDESEDADKMREEAVRLAMRSLCTAQSSPPSP